jgi:uncharacterized protein (TIGR03086 family)
MLTLIDGGLTFAGRIVAGIPDHLRGAPTPCETFDAEHLTAHLINGLRWYAHLPAGGATNPTGAPDPDLSGVPLGPAFDEVAAATRAAWQAAELDAVYDMPFGPVTGAGMTMFMIIEVLGHGWDLAVATGQPADAGPELATGALVVARQLGTSLRGDGMLAAPLPVAADAPPMDRLVAYLGRRPRTTVSGPGTPAGPAG